MNSHVVRSVDTVQEGDVNTPIEGETVLSKLNSMYLDSYDEEMERLMFTVESQKQMIEAMTSEMSQMEHDLKIEIAMKDEELRSLRVQTKCEHCQRSDRALDDNSPPMDFEKKFDPSRKTIESEIRTQEKFGRTDDLVSGLAGGEFADDSPAVVSLEREDKVQTAISESHECGKSRNLVDESTDSCLVTSAGLDENSDTVDFVSRVPAESVDETRISVEKNSRQEVPVLIGHSELEAAHDHLCRGTVDTTALNVINENHNVEKEVVVDTEKEFHPVSALEELCVHLNWTRPKYEFSEVGNSVNERFYTANCSAGVCTIKASGRSKEKAQEQGAKMLFNSVKHFASRRSVVSPKEKSEKNESETNKPIDGQYGNMASDEKNRCQVPTELGGPPSNFKDVNGYEKIGTVKTTINCIKEKCTENIKLEEILTSCPISALQLLCTSRNWGTPVYEYFEEDGCHFIYSVECTVMTCTIRVERLLKKDGKRKAATIMYDKVKHFTCHGDFPMATNPSDKSSTSTEVNCPKLTVRSAVNTTVERNSVGTVDTALNRNYIKIDDPAKDMATKIKFHPINVLQELCRSRRWPLPKYVHHENASARGVLTFSVECTVLACSVTAEGLSKKEAKRQAATIMYRTIENGTKIDSGKSTLSRGQ